MNSCGSNVRKSETVEVIQGDDNVIETILSFISSRRRYRCVCGPDPASS